MSLITVSNLKFKYEDHELFNNLNFRILNNEHVVLLGKNGVGKSTFLKILDKRLIPDSGKVEYLPKIKISYLDQHLEIKTSISIKEYLYGVFSEMFKIESEIEKIYKSLETDLTDYDLKLTRALKMTEQLENSGFYEIDNKCKNILTGLGLKDLDLNKNFKEISGGQKVKLFLSKMLLEKPDLMLLDEPTNFLDKEHIIWLSKYLKNFKGSFIVISHNYEFVKEIAEIIYELENGNIEKYKGNLEYYLDQKDIRKEDLIKKYNKQQNQIKNLKTYIEKNLVRASTTKIAQSRRKQLEKIDVLKKPLNDKIFNINFSFSKSSYLNVLNVNDLLIGYDKPILNPINFNIERGEKIVITGKNGVGKSTLLKSLLGEIKFFDGSVDWSESCDILYFSQEEKFDESETPFSYIKDKFPDMTNEEVRRSLSFLGINHELVFRKLNELSGGEQVRTRMTEMVIKKSNVLILDEPTNHLDQNFKKSLYEAIKNYPGTVILVSHEKEFYDSFKTRIIEL